MSVGMKDKVRDKARDKAPEKARDKAPERDKARESEGRPGRFAGIQRFIRETRSELKKVVWPTRDMAINLTVLVTAVSLAVGIFLGAVDYVFKWLFQVLVGGA